MILSKLLKMIFLRNADLQNILSLSSYLFLPLICSNTDWDYFCLLLCLFNCCNLPDFLSSFRILSLSSVTIQFVIVVNHGKSFDPITFMRFSSISTWHLLILSTLHCSFYHLIQSFLWIVVLLFRFFFWIQWSGIDHQRFYYKIKLKK